MVFTYYSCRKEFEAEFVPIDDKIIIDGWIEQNGNAKVLLTRNFPYFSSFDSASVRDLILTRAKVTLRADEQTEVLTLTRDDKYFPPYVYVSNEILGEINGNYEIMAEFGGKTAKATTTIPYPVPLDTAYFSPVAGDTIGSVYIEFTDPPGKHFYRVFTRNDVNSPFISSSIQAISDIYFSEQTFGFYLKKGSSSLLLSSEDNYYHKGDTVTIKFCTIDQAHYDFWNSFQEEVMNANNPFAASLTAVNSNVEGDGLGIWGGYGVNYKTVILE